MILFSSALSCFLQDLPLKRWVLALFIFIPKLYNLKFAAIEGTIQIIAQVWAEINEYGICWNF